MDLIFVLFETEPALAVEWMAFLAETGAKEPALVARLIQLATKTGTASLHNERLRAVLKEKLT